MRRCIATVSLSGMLREKLQAAAAARFDGAEIFENDLLQFPGSPREARRIADDLGLTIDLYQPFRDFDATTPAQLARNLERAERKFDLMQELGASTILVCSNVQPDALGDPALLAEQFQQLAERAGQRGMFIAYEALAWGSQVKLFSQAWEVVRRVNHPHLGLALDSFHTLSLRDDPAPIAQLPGEKIFFVQLADAPWVHTDVLTHSRHYRCFPGQGEFEMAKFTRAVLDAGYTGPLSLEIFNDEFRAAPARANAVDAMRSLLWLEEQVRLDRAKDAPPYKVPLFDPPPPPRLTGWAFVEFAVDPAAGARLATWLQAIGFRRMGRHRSKQVELYGQVEPWVLFHRAVLGLVPQRNVVLHDPYGVIRSREIESADRAVRLSITVSERDNTSVSRAVSSFRGAGVQQIALAVTDLVATARALKTLGAPLLPVPANYYDDLAAKYDIAPALLAAMRELGILYDREASGGELLQLYTAPLDDRFHFELLERRGGYSGYSGYGAPNAPLRLAAMALWRQSQDPRPAR